jgi:hypothetical protein
MKLTEITEHILHQNNSKLLNFRLKRVNKR